MTKYICPICGNSDVRYIGNRNGKPYCRKCLTFRGEQASEEYHQNNKAEYHLAYQLSNEQKRLSHQLVSNYENNINSLVHAVCGRPKTRKT